MEKLATPPLLDYRSISANYFERLYWNKGLTLCGIDEVGRGPVAGPVVTAAVLLKNNSNSQLIRDSKTLSKKQLIKAFEWICNNSMWAIGTVNHNFIDTHSIVTANNVAMKKALSHLLCKIKPPVSAVIIDAVQLETKGLFNGPIHAFYKAESLSISVAAASIVAKVYRDQLMNTYNTIFNGYHFDAHKGYGTSKHYQALDDQGLSSIHRKSFLKRYSHDSKKQQLLW